MTNSERYRAAFGHLRAPSDAAQRAAGALEHPTGLRRKGRRHMKPLIAAAAVLLVLAGAVGAEASSGQQPAGPSLRGLPDRPGGFHRRAPERLGDGQWVHPHR